MVNFLDKTIAFFRPEAGLRRATARLRFEAISKRGYDGASRGRLAHNWRASNASADTEIALAGPELRARSRDLERNNKWVAKATSVHADNIVGDGIRPRAQSDDHDLNKRLNDLFEEWSLHADPGGMLTFYAQQHVACRTMVISGEAVGRFRTRRLSDNLPLPFQIQLLEPDHIDTHKVSSDRSKSIVNGIEFNRIGNRLAYWLHPNHPGDNRIWTTSNNSSRRVPAKDVFHLYEYQRVQVRGVPWTAPIIMDIKDLHDYSRAEILRKKLESCIVGVLKRGASEGVLPIEREGEHHPPLTDVDGHPIGRMEPGMFYIAEDGMGVEFNNPSVSSSYESYMRAGVRDVSVGLRAPYQLVSNDYSDASYSSSRSALLDYRKFVRSIQQHFMIPMMCRPTWRKFLQYAELMGVLPMNTPVPVIWSLPRFEHINPIDDVRADLLAVRSGFKSLRQVISENGGNPATVLEDIAQTNTDLDAYDLILDTDPRRVTLQGQAQMFDETPPEKD